MRKFINLCLAIAVTATVFAITPANVRADEIADAAALQEAPAAALQTAMRRDI